MDIVDNFAAFQTTNLVYVRPVTFEELPEELRQGVEETDTLYAIHNAQGERLALTSKRTMAFLLALQHNMTPVSVH